MDKTLNWEKLDRDEQYRADVMRVIMVTQAGRNYLATLASEAEKRLPMVDYLVLQAQLGIMAASEKGSVGVAPMAAPAAAKGLAALAGILKAHTMKPLAWATARVTPALKSSWTWITAGGVGRPALVAASAFFATDYVISSFKGNQPEVNKLYQSGREVLGSTVSTTSSLIKLIPLGLIAWGVYSFITVSKTHQKAN